MQSAKGSFYVPTFKPADVNQNNFIHWGKVLFCSFQFSNLQCNNSIQQKFKSLYIVIKSDKLVRSWCGCKGEWGCIYHSSFGSLRRRVTYCGVLSKWEWTAFLASILPRVMKEGESKEGSSHFDEKISIW